MSAETTRTAWTDDRLDDLQSEVRRGFARMDARFDRMDARMDGFDDRFDGLYRVIITLGGGIIAAIIVGAAGIIATQV